ncbi:MAG: tetratricopeptide repeat protein, partial [Blastocatellia bacterium]|nr:tetratricopeptide repeat protein [Blastocatellia bacterium]
AEDQPQSERPLYYDRAEPLLKRALAIGEKTLGKDDINLAEPLFRLAHLYIGRGDYAKAEPLLQRSLANIEKALGSESSNLAFPLTDLATIHLRGGDYQGAETLFQRALVVREKALPANHQLIGESLYRLGLLDAAKGDFTQATNYLARASDIIEKNYALNIAIGSERQKVAFLMGPISKLVDLSLTIQNEAKADENQAVDLAFKNILLWKARALDAMTDTISTLRRYATPEDQALLNELVSARSQLASLKLKDTNAAGTDKNLSYGKRVNQLEKDVDNLEAKLSSRSVEFRTEEQAVTVAAVQAVLPADGALIEFAYYKPV